MGERNLMAKGGPAVWQLVFGTGLAIFAGVSLAIKYHFVSEETASKRFLALSVLSVVNIFMFARDLWLRPKSTTLLAIALVLFIVSAALFAWSLRASRSARLKLIFDHDEPQFILRSGPYRYIRHPFYASYFPFWIGCAVATLHPFNLAYVLFLIPTLVFAARQEEKRFDQSAQAQDYAAYRRTAGLFWPKF